MSDWIQAHPLVVVVPLVIAWAVALVDIAMEASLSTRAKWLWAVACTVLWPLIMVFWLTRPVEGRAEGTTQHTDPRARLVEAVLDREAGRIDDEQFVEIVDDLRRSSPAS